MIQSPRWFRRVVSVLVCLVAVWLLYDIVINAMTWYFIQQVSKDHPNLGAVPVLPPNNGQAKLHGAQLTAFGYSLQVPWDDVDTRKDAGSIASWYFKRGVVVVLFRPSAPNFLVDVFRAAKHHQKVEQVLGARALSSDYDFLSAELNTKPSQIHWWSSRAAKVRAFILLTGKSTEIMQARAIYTQSSKEMRGFQFSDEFRSPYSYTIELDLFDRNDRRYRIWIGEKAKQTFITQAELNALVASLKPISR